MYSAPAQLLPRGALLPQHEFLFETKVEFGHGQGESCGAKTGEAKTSRENPNHLIHKHGLTPNLRRHLCKAISSMTLTY